MCVCVCVSEQAGAPREAVQAGGEAVPRGAGAGRRAWRRPVRRPRPHQDGRRARPLPPRHQAGEGRTCAYYTPKISRIFFNFFYYQLIILISLIAKSFL
jgi:hypothetical protein